MKRLFLAFLLLFISVLFVGCEKNKLEIYGESSVEKGCGIVLTHNYKGEETVIWSSSDDKIASVFEGTVVGNSEGVVTITITIGEETASKEITVTHNIINITIKGQSIINVGESIQFEAVLDKELEEKVTWKSEDESVLIVDNNGVVTGVNIGETEVTASLGEFKSSFKVSVVNIMPISIGVIGSNKVGLNDNTTLEIDYNPSNSKKGVIFESLNEDIVVVNQEGIVTGVSIGKGTIKVTSTADSDVFTTFVIEVVSSLPSEVVVTGNEEMIQGKYNHLSANVVGNNVTQEVVWKTSDPTIAIVYQGIVLAVNKGTVTISAHSIVDESIKDSIEIVVTGYEAQEVSQAELTKVNQIINSMTLEQKIGQMFTIGFNGTIMTDTLASVIEEYHFGNVIYMGANVTDYNTLGEMSNAIQEKMVSANKVPAFISIDQEGGRVARLVNGGTHFISNMAMGATGDYNTTYLEGKAMGQELRNYGINVDFAPVLDVNNNPENPIIGIRSYSDNPLLVSLYGNNMIKGLTEANVIGCSKHFPGHGNTSVDSHYGLPTITTQMDELYQTELAPFISAVSNGIDAIMTTHIIFTAIDSEYPATLSSKVLTGLLREELGYDGIIFTDGMEMNAVSQNFGDYGEVAVLAVKAGVDILTYTSNNNPRKAHSALVSAVNNGEITEERINESVRRILLKKIKYGILDNYQALDQDISSLLADNEELNLQFAMDSLTLVKGAFNGLDKNKKTLIVSPTTTFDLGYGLESNSFANYASKYLKQNGYNCDYLVVNEKINSSEISKLMNTINGYDQIVIAMSNVKTKGYTGTAQFVNNVAKTEKELLVIALDTPYDLMSYKNVNNYVCVYGYQKATVIALAKYLNGEYKAKGVCSVDKSIFE